MNKFITLENGNYNDYFFNDFHFLILFISLVIIIFFCMYAFRQKLKFQKIFVFVSAVLILLFEILRLVWRYYYLQYQCQELSFLNIVDFNFFNISLWISIPLLFFAPFLKKKKTESVFGLSFVFSVSSLAGIMSLIYPTGINPYFEFYQVYNLIFVLIRSLVIMLGMFFACAKWIKTESFLDLWRGVLSLFIVGSVCVFLYFIFGGQTNLFYINFNPLFVTLGIYIPFPWHIFIMGMFLFVFQLLLYLPFRLYKYFKYRKR